jgi:putative membrane protein
MDVLAIILVGVVALEHIYILCLEMFLWTTPRALKVFGMAKDEAETSKVLAANLGLYNGFLAAGLIWGLVHPTVEIGTQVQCFFLGCVIVAAIYGGATAKKSILLVQGVPATLALFVLLLS